METGSSAPIPGRSRLLSASVVDLLMLHRCVSL